MKGLLESSGLERVVGLLAILAILAEAADLEANASPEFARFYQAATKVASSA
jgi:hypothetical protein